MEVFVYFTDGKFESYDDIDNISLLKHFYVLNCRTKEIIIHVDNVDFIEVY